MVALKVISRVVGKVELKVVLLVAMLEDQMACMMAALMGTLSVARLDDEMVAEMDGMSAIRAADWMEYMMAVAMVVKLAVEKAD